MIWETVVTTRAPDGRVHIAPMGIRLEGAQIVLAPFRPSSTLDNVLASRVAAVNVVDDVRVFAGCLTGHRDWPVVACERIAGVRLTGAVSHRELELQRVDDDPQRPRLYCDVVADAVHRGWNGFNRAQAAVIEAAILVSRLDLLPAAKIDSELAYLATAVEKTAGPVEREAWCWLTARVEQFRSGLRQEKI